MTESIEDIIRRIVREELAAAQVRHTPAPVLASGYYPACTCFQGGSIGTGGCPLHGVRDPHSVRAVGASCLPINLRNLP